jgi:O-methyltransferase domain/Dimerisation domain
MSSPSQTISELPPAARIYQLATSYWIPRALYLVVQLGIPDLLKNGPKSVEELAASTQSNPDALLRVLRAVASLGVFAETAPRQFALTPLSETLRSDVPGSLRNIVLFIANDYHWDTYKALAYSVRTGEAAFDHVFGQNAWEYLSERPEESLLVDQAMALGSALAAPAIAAAYDFSKFQTIMDVGGGNGALLAAILKQHTQPRGIVFDLPHAIRHAHESGALPDGRGELIAGSFFEKIPPGADAYLLKNIIHDWADDKARTILKNCRGAMSGSNKLLLIERLLPPDSSADRPNFADIEMLVMNGGRERTEEDFRQLLAGAGFRLDRIVPTKAPVSIIEASLA